MEKKASSITSIILFLFTGHITISTSNQCTDYVLLDGPEEETRSPLLGISGFAISDDRLTTGWYRSNLTAGTDMTKDCPLLMRCGTIPAVSEGEVERSVCKLSISGSCCDSSYNSLTIKIKNCGDFRVYYLDTSGVPASSAFCFGDIPKETTTSDQTVMASSGMSTLQSTAMPDSESTMSGSQNIVTTTSVKPTTQNSTTVEQGTISSTSVINQFMFTRAGVKNVTKTTTETTTLPASVDIEMTTNTESTTLITATDSTVKSITGYIGLTKITDSTVTSTQTNTTLNDESSVQIETVTGNGLSTNELTTAIALTTLMGRDIIDNNASSTTMLRHNHSTTFNRKDQATKTIIIKSTENVSVTSNINNFKTIPNSGVITTNHDTFNDQQHFGHVDLFVDFILLNIIAVYSLSLSIIIFKITTKNCKMSLKLPIQGQQHIN